MLAFVDADMKNSVQYENYFQTKLYNKQYRVSDYLNLQQNKEI